MSIIRPFCAYRPEKELCDKIAALPYDVMNSAEAARMTAGNPYSFLHVDKAEIDLPEGIDIYSPQVYEKAAENLDNMIRDGWYVHDDEPKLYVYAQTMNGRTQTGLVGCASVDDYLNNTIKKHEHTRADKEADRIRHVDVCNANTGPIFLAYRECAAAEEMIKKYTAHTPEYDFLSDGVRNTVWVIDDKNDIDTIVRAFAAVDSLYIADGHHRAASAVKVSQKRREEKKDYDGTEEFNYFLAVYFKASDLAIMDYNRLLADKNGLSSAELTEKISGNFTVERKEELYKPEARHTFGMYLDGTWYKLTAKDGSYKNDVVSALDVSILQNNVIEPVFGISNPRSDKRIDFVGGIRGLAELERRCREDMEVAFAMYPTSLDELMAIADSGLVMPPKSTWFEPKLLSGIFIHKLS